jgi:putative lipoprotein (rSAM/lipoprotein system)
MKKLLYRPLALILSFMGFMIGFTSKVLAQYGAPVMHFKLLGQVKSVGCEQAVGGVEVALVNDVTGQVTKVRTDSEGNFNFRILEYYWEYEFTMNLADIDGDANQGEFVSKSLRFKLTDVPSEHIANDYWSLGQNNKPMTLYLDFVGENPCAKDITPPQLDLLEDSLMIDENDYVSEPDSHDLLNTQNERELEIIDPVLLYPNPNDGRFTIEFTAHETMQTEIQVYDLKGKLIKSIRMMSEQGRQSVSIDVVGVSPQTLIVRLILGSFVKDFRVVVM